jgi:hypothetical protein
MSWYVFQVIVLVIHDSELFSQFVHIHPLLKINQDNIIISSINYCMYKVCKKNNFEQF